MATGRQDFRDAKRREPPERSCRDFYRCNNPAARLPQNRHSGTALRHNVAAIEKRKGNTMGLILLIVILFLLFGGGGYYGYRSGYYGGAHYGGGLTLIVVIVVLFLLFGGHGGYYHY
jgi:hypothetical protein